MTRSLGNLNLKESGVVGVPDIVNVDIQENDSFVILATDGVFDFVGDHEAMGVVCSPDRTPLEAAQELSNIAITYGSPDNVTCAVVPLDPLAWHGRMNSDGSEEDATYARVGFAGRG